MENKFKKRGKRKRKKVKDNKEVRKRNKKIF